MSESKEDKEAREKAEAETAAAAAAAAADAKKVKARVLVAHDTDAGHHEPDDVVKIDAGAAKAQPGLYDANPAAVKYAESLKD